MRIVRLTVENFLKVVAVDIKPGTRDTVVISGKNGQGKSGVLDSIALALAGGKAKKLIEPIHKGAEKAEVVVETEELFITRTWKQNGTPGTLKVRNKNGRSYSSPQAFLDGLIGKLSFDPLAFSRSKPGDQRESLIKAMGVDTTELDRQREQAYVERTDINRLLKHQQAIVDEGGSEHEELPDEMVNIESIWAEHQKAKDLHDGYDGMLRKKQRLIEVKGELQQEILTYENQLAKAKKRHMEIAAELNSFETRIIKVKATLPNLEGITSELTEANAINGKIGKAVEYRAAKKGRDNLQEKSNILTKRLSQLEFDKRGLMAKATVPVKGLGVTQSGITFEGVPFSQISEAEKMRVSIAIAMTLNPKLRVISVSNASLLDDDSMAMVERMAKQNDFQIWLEVVKQSDEGTGFIIEDGELVGVEREGS